MKSDEVAVSEFLANRGLVTAGFSKQERRERKTPDYRVFKDDTLIGYCEVKSIEKDLKEESRNDPIFNRLTDDIHCLFGLMTSSRSDSFSRRRAKHFI